MTKQELIKNLEDRKLTAILNYREAKGDEDFELAEVYKKEVQNLAQQIKEAQETNEVK